MKNVERFACWKAGMLKGKGLTGYVENRVAGRNDLGSGGVGGGVGALGGEGVENSRPMLTWI